MISFSLLLLLRPAPSPLILLLPSLEAMSPRTFYAHGGRFGSYFHSFASFSPCLPVHPSASDPFRFTQFISTPHCIYELPSYTALLALTQPLFKTRLNFFLSDSSLTLLIEDFDIHLDSPSD